MKKYIGRRKKRELTNPQILETVTIKKVFDLIMEDLPKPTN